MRCEEEKKHYKNTQLVAGVLASLSSEKLFKFTCYPSAALNSNDKYILPGFHSVIICQFYRA